MNSRTGGATNETTYHGMPPRRRQQRRSDRPLSTSWSDGLDDCQGDVLDNRGMHTEIHTNTKRIAEAAKERAL